MLFIWQQYQLLDIITNFINFLEFLKKSLDDKIKTIKREISTVVATVNPEIEKVFPNIFTKTAIAIIKSYPTAMDISKATPLILYIRHSMAYIFAL